MLPGALITGKRKSVCRFGLTEAEVRKKPCKLSDIIEDEGPVSIPIERMIFAELAKEYEEDELILTGCMEFKIERGYILVFCGQEAEMNTRRIDRSQFNTEKK